MLFKDPLWINRGTNVNPYYVIDNQIIKLLIIAFQDKK